MATSSVAWLLVATLLSAANEPDNMIARSMNTLDTFINVPLTLEILAGEIQQTRRVAVIHFLQNGVRQVNAVNAPAALRRYFGRGVIEILVLGFQKAVVNLVQLIVKHLLRKLVPMRSRISSEKNTVLILVEEFTARQRLTAYFPRSCGDIDGHVGKAVKIIRDVLQIFGKITHM